jgi:vesicle coat complex subunit
MEPNQFRQTWLDCEWENVVTFQTQKLTLKELLQKLKEEFKFTEIGALSIKSEKFCSLSMYSHFSLGKDLLLNLSLEIGE